MVLSSREGVGMGLMHLGEFHSRHISARGVSVWFPDHVDDRLPVIYMHDGQNLFEAERSYGGTDWGVDEALLGLMAHHRVAGAVVVGVWNTSLRLREYMPSRGRHGLRPQSGGSLSDGYLRFLVEELKPAIDQNFRTLSDPGHTYTMGSSMGGLISLYALCEYPHVVGGAGCVSTHWPAGNGRVLDYMDHHLPDPGRHRLYFDYGTRTADEPYEPYQHRADQIMWSHGYRQPEDWLTMKFDGADHSEEAWRARIHLPLEFLLAGAIRG
jgi:predicted alpha/beta superfamily hydrolase